MTTAITIDEAQANLKDLIARLSPGDELVIMQNDRPVAEIRIPSGSPRPQFGVGAGMIDKYIDDDEHLKDFADYMP